MGTASVDLFLRDVGWKASKDNAEGLRCGVVHVPNETGQMYMSGCHLSCNLRSLRESFDECIGIFPTLLKMTIDETTWKLSWEAGPSEEWFEVSNDDFRHFH
jgi:hypothetical protein